ncbi:MAG: TPM domain-containing protein [Candidatus Acidiferrales bacterium]
MALLACAIVFLTGVVSAEKPEQLKPRGYVNDFANVLSQRGRDQLTALCTEVDQKAKAQIAIVTVKSLEGRSIEDFSMILTHEWGIGPKQSSRGVLILYSIGDRTYRPEIGYGLEAILPDGKVGAFGRETVPFLKEGNYDAAILLMTRRIADVIAADSGVKLSGAEPVRPRGTQHVNGFPVLIFGIIVAFLIFFSMFRGSGPGSRYNRRGRGGGGWWIGPMIGGGMGGGGFGGGGFGGGGGGGGGGGFGGFGGGSFGGGGATGSW